MRSSPKNKPVIRTSPKHPDRAKKEVVTDSGISRYRLLFSAAIAVAMGTTGYLLIKNPEQPTGARVTETKEVDLQNEIILGNVRFHLKDPVSVPAAAREDLFRKMRNAYEKLVGYFGEEIMTASERLDIPIKYNTDDNAEKCGVTWNVKVARANADGSIILRSKPTPDNLRIFNHEKVIAHEFVHIYLQPAGGVESLAFREGHAHAVDKQLYGIDRADRDYYTLADHPEINRLLDIGMDFNQVDVTPLNGGGSYTNLNSIVRRKWSNAWTRLMEKDPSFMKNFYGEIAKLKKSGIIDFSKQTYLDIAKRVSPHFEEWYRDAKCVKEIGETGSEKVQESMKLPDNRVLIANFQPKPRGAPSGRSRLPIPPILEMPVNGRGSIEYTDSKGNVRSYHLSIENYLFEIVKLPDEVFNGSNLKVLVDGVEIPFRIK